MYVSALFSVYILGYEAVNSTASENIEYFLLLCVVFNTYLFVVSMSFICNVSINEMCKKIGC